MAEEIAGGAAAVVVEPAAAVAATTSWTTALDAETQGYLSNRGWDKLTPAEAAANAAKAHREAERFVGAPSDKLVRLADPTNPAGYRAMWGRLGAPGEAAKYDLSNAKTATGEGLDPALVTRLQTAFDEANVPLSAAQQVAQSLAKYRDETTAASVAEAAALDATNKADLARSWGPNADNNLFVAKKAAEKLGVTPEVVQGLEKLQGYAKTMEMFRQIGEQMGEARFITNTTPGGVNTGAFTREGATEKLNELKSDTAWTARYLAGGQAEARQMQALIEQASGGQERFADYRAI